MEKKRVPTSMTNFDAPSPAPTADAAAAPLQAGADADADPVSEDADLPGTPKHRTTAHYVMQGDANPTTPTAAPGALDKFFNYSTNAVTIQAPAHVPSPSSTISWSASPDFVAGFPADNNSSDHSVVSHKTRRRQQQQRIHNENHVLKVCIESSSFYDDDEQVLEKGSNHSNSHHGSFFFVPVSLMLQREIEMQEAARVNRIGQDRWSRSRIFRMWKTQRSKNEQQQQNEIMTIRLTPEVSLEQQQQPSEASALRFRWKPWLTTCIRAYYNTGVLRIPQACQGDDILLALEYFGILTANMDMFVFESSEAFERVKAWSRYFAYRTQLAEELLEAFDQMEDEQDANKGGKGSPSTQNDIDNDHAKSIVLRPSPHANMWVLVAEETGSFPSVGSEQELRSLLRVGGVDVRTLPVASEGGLYDLFCKSDVERESKPEYEQEQQLSERLRQDFARFVQLSLPPHVSVTFTMTKVEKAPSSISTLRDCDGYSNTSFEMKPVIAIGRVNEIFEHETKEAKALEVKKGFDAALPIQSEVVDKKIEDVNNTAIESSSVDNTRWKLSSDDNECQQSLHTKTLAGEGISPKITPTSSSPLSKKVLFLDETIHEQPQLNSENHGNNAHPGFPIKPRISDNCPISPRSLLVEHCVNDWMSKYQTDDIQTGTNVAPVTYVNTEFGDLQSVTSVLTDPVLDSSETAYLMSVLKSHSEVQSAKANQEILSREEEKRLIAEAAKRIIQRRRNVHVEGQKTEARGASEGSSSAKEILDEAKETSLIQKAGIASSSAFFPDDNTLRASSPDLVKTDASSQESNVEVGPTMDSHSQDVIEANPATGSKDAWTELGLLISGLCEAVIPMGDGTSDPARASRATGSQSVGAEKREAPASDQNERPFAGCPCRQDRDSILMDNETSHWIPPTPATDDPDIKKDAGKAPVEDLLNPETLLEGAKQLGRDISIQFDALMKMAIEGSGEMKEIVEGAMAPIPEDGPSPMLDLEKPVEITTKKLKQIGPDSYAIPKSQSFDSDPLADALVPFPPHQPRRQKNKIAVARKKSSPKKDAALQQPTQSTVQRQKRGSASTKDVSVSSLSESSSGRRMHTKHTDNRKMLL